MVPAMASSRAAASAAMSDCSVLNTTLPLCMYVATSAWPSEATTSRRSAMGTFL